MKTIQVELSKFLEDEKSYICLKVLDDKWTGAEEATLFSETSEGLLKGSHDYFLFDCSALEFATSIFFGSLVNLVELAKELNKTIKFKFNDDIMDTLQVAGIEKILTIVP